MYLLASSIDNFLPDEPLECVVCKSKNVVLAIKGASEDLIYFCSKHQIHARVGSKFYQESEQLFGSKFIRTKYPTA